jgi:hypothetical protein
MSVFESNVLAKNGKANKEQHPIERRRGDQVWLYSEKGEIFLGVIIDHIAGRYRVKLNKKEISAYGSSLVDTGWSYSPDDLFPHYEYIDFVNSFKCGDGISLFNCMQLPYRSMNMPDILYHYFVAVNNINQYEKKKSSRAYLIPFGSNAYIMKCPDLNQRKPIVAFSKMMRRTIRERTMDSIYNKSK